MNPPDLPLELLRVDVLAALLFVDQRPLVGAAGLLDWRLDGAVTRMLQSGGVSGRRGERLLLRAGAKLSCDWVLMLGAGKRRDCSGSLLQSLLADIRRSCERAGFKQIGVALPLELQPLVHADEPSAVSLGLSTQMLFIDDAIMA